MRDLERPEKSAKVFRCYNIGRIIFEMIEPISDDLSAVQWPYHHPGAGVLAEIMPRRLL